jgi:hypothetical protein
LIVGFGEVELWVVAGLRAVILVVGVVGLVFRSVSRCFVSHPRTRLGIFGCHLNTNSSKRHICSSAKNSTISNATSSIREQEARRIYFVAGRVRNGGKWG